MREMDVLSPGTSYDRCQYLKSNPRREGLPRTVTEWREKREERRQERRLERERLNNPDLRSESEGEDLSAFDIVNSEQDNGPVGVRRSERVRGKRRASRLGNQDPKVLGARPQHHSSSSTPVLTLDPIPENSTGTGETLSPNPSTSDTGSRDLGKITPVGVKKGSPPQGFIYALQEPPTVGKRIVNIKNTIQVMDTKCLEKKNPEKPRAAIICSNHLNMWPIPEHCCRDMAVGLLKETSLGDIYVVSLYCDGEKGKKAVPRFFRQFRNTAKREKIPILLLMDSNSHSEVLWSSKRTDRRGKEWEEFMANDQGLVVSNIGDHFTFMSKKGQTIIDVTMASPLIAEKISQWGVVDSISNSDHLSIEMLLQLDKGWSTPLPVWDLKSKKFDKDGFTAKMENLSKQVGRSRFWNPTDLDNNGQSIVDDMTTALDETAPLAYRSTNIARAGWFDTECKRLLRRCKQIRQYIRDFTRKRIRSCLLYTSPSPRDQRGSRMPSSA